MDYQAMYVHLMHECERARCLIAQAQQIIIKAQRECEEMYLRQEDTEKPPQE